MVGEQRDEQPQQEVFGDFLARLAARTPTPAGGAVAAHCTAQAAALVAMVARYCNTEPLVAQAESLVQRAERLAEDDERAFAEVAAAWALPKESDGETGGDRRTAIDAALLGAAEPQAAVVETAVEVLVLIDQLHLQARPGISADLVAAAEIARAGSTIARMNVESNLDRLPDSQARSALYRRMGTAGTSGRA